MSGAVSRAAVDRPVLERLAATGALTALVDACDAPGVPDRVLAHAPEGGACLYQGHEARAFRDRAPYLVRVDPALLGWLLAPAAAGGLGDTPWGVFTIADVPFVEQVRHWRGWLTVTPPEGGEPWAFRFYDPRLVGVFLGACAADEVAAFFGPVRSLVVPAWDAAGTTGWMLTPGPAARGAGRARRGVGERFRMRDAHVAAFRRRNFGGALIRSVNREADALGQRAWRDPADPVAGDVLVGAAVGGGRPGGPAGAAPPMRIGFDARGFVGSVTSPLGRRWTIESGPEGEPRGMTLPSGGRLTFAYGADGHVARVARGARGGPNAERTLFTFEHDAAGRVTRTAYPDRTQATTAYLHAGDRGVLDLGGERPTEVTDRLGRTTRYAYDADGDLTAITDARGRATRFAYAGWRRPVAMTRPDGSVERYAYGGDGHLAAVTGPDGVVLRVRCDDAGRMLAVASGGGTRVDGVEVALARDGAGRITEARTEARGAPLGTAALAAPTAAVFAYDHAGRVVRETVTVGPVGVAAAGGAALTAGAAPLRTAVDYAYDPQGVQVGFTGPTGERLGYAHDADGRLAAVTDWAGREYRVTYAAADGGWTLRAPDGVTTTCVQNPTGHPMQVVTRAPDGAVVADVATRYDAEDRVAAVDDRRLGAWAYAYDAEGQVVACDGPTAAESARYAYDAAGNRVRVAQTSGEHAYDTWHPASACEVDGGDRLLRQGAVRLAYDAAGRAVTRSDAHGGGPEGEWRYAYDARGQLVRAWGRGADGVARALAFAYDGLGRRVWKLVVERAGWALDKRVTARRTRFVWAGEHLVREVVEAAAWDAAAPAPYEVRDEARDEALAAALLGGEAASGAVWRQTEARDYAYWPGTATPLLLRVTRPNGHGGGDADAPAASATYLYECDHLGAPVRLVDAAGRVVWEAAYAPFGAARVAVGEVTQPWRRPGQYADAETRLCYNRLRYYDPALGRYLTPDPAGLLGGLHPYRYARNGPTWDADPLGLWPSFGTIVAAVAAVAVAVTVAVVLAPVVATAAVVILAGVAAGATFGFLNEGLNNGFGCASCLLKSTLKGAVVGGLAAVPFVFLPATAGIAAFAAVGGGSGAIGYTADWALNGADPSQWSWGGFAASVGFGALTAGAGRYIAPKVSNWWNGRNGAAATEAPSAAEPRVQPRPFEPEPLPPGETVGSDGLTGAQRARFRSEIDNPPPGKTADDVRYERNTQARANRGEAPIPRDEWQASNDQLRANSARGTEQQDAARGGLSDRLGRDLSNNNEGQVVQRTVTDPETGNPVTTRPDSIGRNADGDIDLVHDHKDLSGSNKVVYDDAQMRAERAMLEDPNGRHVVTVSSDSPRLSASPPEPRPSGPLANKSEVYFTNESGRVTHQWHTDPDLPGGGFWEPVN